jgi:hypothetical protein
MAKAGKNLSTLLRGLTALDLPPETLQALDSYISRIPAAAAGAGADATSRLVGNLRGRGIRDDEIARMFAAIDPANQPAAAALAKHPELAELFAGPSSVWAKIEAAIQCSEAPDTADKELSPLKHAVKKRLDMGKTPGRNETWPLFYHAVRTDCGPEAWTDSKRQKPARGYGDRTIERIVQSLKRQD